MACGTRSASWTSPSAIQRTSVWIPVGLTAAEPNGRFDGQSGLAGPSDAAHADQAVVA